MTTEEIRKARLELQESIDHFLTVTSDLIEAINNHFDKIYGEYDER